MKLLTRCAAILIILAGFSLGGPPRSLAFDDAIIAVVNDELITLKDLQDYVHSTYVSLVAEGMKDDELNSIMKEMEANGITKLIEDKLILSKANKIGLEVREELIEERINAMKTKYGSASKLIEALIKNGATMTDLRNKIKDQLKIKYVVDHEVKSKVYVNPQEVTEYFEKNKTQFNRQDRVNLKSIFIAADNDRAAALAKAQQALKLMEEGKNFDEVAREYSQAPSVGHVTRGQFLPVIEKIVFNLNIDEVSAPIEVESGVYIFKLIGQSSAKDAKLEDVKDSIYNLLYKEKFKDRLTTWLKKLKKDAYIEIKS